MIKRLWWYAVISFFIFALYYRVLGVGLLSDDWFWHSPGDFNWGLVTGSESTLYSGFQNGFYRPVSWVVIGFLIDYHAPIWAFHLHNLIMHCVNGLLAFVLLQKLFEKRLAFLGTLLFVAMPYHAGTVAWISGVCPQYLLMFTLLMGILHAGHNKLYAYFYNTPSIVRCRNPLYKFWTGIYRHHRLFHIFRMTAFILLFVLAIHSHEMGYGLVLAMPFIFGWRRSIPFAALAGLSFWHHHHVIGGVGMYGWGFYATALNPVNWLVNIGYYLKWLLF